MVINLSVSPMFMSLGSTVGPGAVIEKLELLESSEVDRFRAVALTNTLAVVVQRLLGTVQSKVRIAGPSFGVIGSFAIAMSNVVPAFVDRKRSKPLTCGADTSGTSQVI